MFNFDRFIAYNQTQRTNDFDEVDSKFEQKEQNLTFLVTFPNYSTKSTFFLNVEPS